jgi:ETFB lysine methyltransferase
VLRFRYQTFEFDDMDVHLRTLRDTQQFDDPDGVAAAMGIRADTWSLFGVVWTSSEILAQMMFEFDFDNKRILEFGCGVALASHVLNMRGADITATDFHPEAEAFLSYNVALNEQRSIPFFSSRWDDEQGDMGKFDVIIASEVLYEPKNIESLVRFIVRHAKAESETIILDRGRGVVESFTDAMITNGFSHSTFTPACTDQLGLPYEGAVHRYIRHA